MTNALEVLEAQALKLSAADRSRLLERLLASLDVDPDVEAAWDEVADARESALEGGQVTAVPLDEAIARLETRPAAQLDQQAPKRSARAPAAAR